MQSQNYPKAEAQSEEEEAKRENSHGPEQELRPNIIEGARETEDQEHEPGPGPGLAETDGPSESVQLHDSHQPQGQLYGSFRLLELGKDEVGEQSPENETS